MKDNKVFINIILIGSILVFVGIAGYFLYDQQVAKDLENKIYFQKNFCSDKDFDIYYGLVNSEEKISDECAKLLKERDNEIQRTNTIGFPLILTFTITYLIFTTTLWEKRLKGLSSFISSVVTIVLSFYFFKTMDNAGLAGPLLIVIIYPIILVFSILAVVFGISSLRLETGVLKVLGIMGLILAAASIVYLFGMPVLRSLIH